METQNPSPQAMPPISEPIPSIETVQKPSSKVVSTMNFPVKKIFFGLVGIILIGGIALAAKFLSDHFTTTSSPQTTAQPITLVYWGMLEEDANLKTAISQFEQQNPGLTVEYSQQSPKDYYNRLVSACARSQCPDLMSFHSTWTQSLSQRGILSTLPSSAMSASEYQQTFYPAAGTDLQISGGFAGIPLSMDGLGLYVNKKLLQASGRSVPVTWDELRSLAAQLTIHNSDNSLAQSGVALGTATNIDHFSDILAVLIFQNSGNPMKPEAFASTGQTGTGGGDSASLAGDALTFYAQFTHDDKIWDDTMPNSTYAFAIGKVAMIFAPVYRAAEIKKINPNFDFAVYPIPQLPGKPVTLANYWAEGVSKTSKQTDLAWKLLAFLASKPVQQQLFSNSSQVPMHISSRRDLLPMISADPYTGAIASQLLTAKSSFMSSRTFDGGINDKLGSLYADAITKMATGTKYQDLAPKFSQDVQQVAASYGILR